MPLRHDLADIYTLTKDDLLQLDRFRYFCQKLIDAIADKNSRRCCLRPGIRHVGVQTAIDLGHFAASKNFPAPPSTNSNRSTVSAKLWPKFAAWFADPDNEALLEKFAALGVQRFEKKQGKLMGKTLSSPARSLA